MECLLSKAPDWRKNVTIMSLQRNLVLFKEKDSRTLGTTLVASENPFMRHGQPSEQKLKSRRPIFYKCCIFELQLYSCCGLVTSHFSNMPLQGMHQKISLHDSWRERVSDGGWLHDKYMGMWFPFRMMKMFWNWIEVMVVQHCWGTKYYWLVHFKRVTFMVSEFNLNF